MRAVKENLYEGGKKGLNGRTPRNMLRASNMGATPSSGDCESIARSFGGL